MRAFSPERDTLEKLARLSPAPWSGPAWRQLPTGVRPSEPNTRGARWNPPGVQAIYTSVQPDVARAEALHRASLQPARPSKSHHLHELRLRLSSVRDLTAEGVLENLGLTRAALASLDMTMTQGVGGAAEWLQHDGLLVPSVRADGSNLVVFAAKLGADSDLVIVRSELITLERET